MLGPHGHTDGQGGTDQDVLAPGVGALVEAHHRRPALVLEPHVDRRSDGADHGHGRRGPETPRRPQPPTEVEHDEDDGRPHDVELLLDGERPHVLEHRGLGRGGEVVPSAHDEVPVGHVEQGGQRVEAEAGELPGARKDLHDQGHTHQHHQEGGQEAAGPTRPQN